MVEVKEMNPLSLLSENILIANLQLATVLWVASLFLAEVAGPEKSPPLNMAYAVNHFGGDESPKPPEIPKRQNFLMTREYRDWL